MLLHGLRRRDYRGKLAVSAMSRQEASELERHGADLVLIPYADAARQAADRLMSETRAQA